jgi:hypothetical protein
MNITNINDFNISIEKLIRNAHNKYFGKKNNQKRLEYFMRCNLKKLKI